MKNINVFPIVLVCIGHAVLAQTPPNAGSISRDALSTLPALPPSKATLPQEGVAQPSTAQSTDTTPIAVKSISITGATLFTADELQALVADVASGSHTLSELQAAASRITAHYRQAGYLLARAYLPAQSVKEGAITINVIEGRIASRRVNNESRLSDAVASAYLGNIKDGEVVQSSQIDRSVLLLQDTPGVSSSRATLQPGASVGTSELLVEVKGADAVAGNVVLDNYGSRYTGVLRMSAALSIASPFKMGDQINVDVMGSEANLSFARVAYQVPLGSDGLRAGAAYMDTRYTLGKEYAALQAHGVASSTTVFAAYPFIRTKLHNLNGTVSYESKGLTDYVDSTATVTDKSVNITSLALAGNLQDGWGGGGANHFDMTLALGQLRINSPAAQAIDAAAAQTNGTYSRLSYSASRQQRLTADTTLLLAVNGQQASKNLDSSEKFVLGGINGVRAYPQGEASGDEGYKATLELRYNLMANLQGAVFYDMGEIAVNKAPFAVAASNNRSLSGAGIGLQGSVGRVQLKASVAWRTDGGTVVSIPASAAQMPTVWVQGVVGF